MCKHSLKQGYKVHYLISYYKEVDDLKCTNINNKNINIAIIAVVLYDHWCVVSELVNS